MQAWGDTVHICIAVSQFITLHLLIQCNS